MEYLIHDSEKQTGPYTLEQLQNMWVIGAVNLETLYWAKGMKEWQKLRNIVTILQPTTPSQVSHAVLTPEKHAGSTPQSSQRSSKNIVRVLFAGTVVIACLTALGIWISKTGRHTPIASVQQLSDTFRQLLDKFLTDASRLNSLSSQGTSYQSFGDQLATTVASFELLAPAWPADYQSDAKHEVKLAVEGWGLLYQLWGRQFKEFKAWKYDDKSDASLGSQTVGILESYAPGRIVYVPKDGQYPMTEANYHYLIQSNVRVLLGVASEHFTTARALLLDNTKR